MDETSLRIRAVLDAKDKDFVGLVKLAGLNPATDFRYNNLEGIDFSDCDLTGFDFTGAKTDGANWKGAKVSGAIFDKGPQLWSMLYDASDFEQLLKKEGLSETVIREAIRKGPNHFQVNASEIISHAHRRMEVEAKLRRALENDEFQLFYQEMVDLESRDVIGAEALLRWNNPDLGFVSPIEFIPVAEETGLIGPIGDWVLRTACKDAAEWTKIDHPPMQVSVNLSGPELLKGNVSEKVQNTLSETGLSPELLNIEITESTLTDDSGRIIDILSELRELGVTQSLTEYGTGYSSLAYLLRAGVHSIKIHRTFISCLPDDENAAMVTQAIATMSQQLDYRIAAEGIETREQEEFLRGLGCDVGQGYLYSKPMPADQFEETIRLGTGDSLPSRDIG